MAEVQNHDQSVLDESKAAHEPSPITPSTQPTWECPRVSRGNSMYPHPTNNVVMVRRSKHKDDSTWRAFTQWFMENQIGLALNLIALLFLAHGLIPKAKVHTRKFFSLSYQDSQTGKYAAGFDDVYLITFFVVLFTGLRAFVMEYSLVPLAKRVGVEGRKSLVRFSEQGWLLCYYVVFWTTGVYIYVNSPHYLSFENLWTDWPDREVTGLMKSYILAQWAFWIQQILVIHLEERRKDHWQMLSHHIITTALISACYSYHHTRVGNLILVAMDVVDLFLPLAKCLKYAGSKTICDVVFGAFMLTWISFRHVLYMMICWSIYRDVPRIIPHGCYSGPNADLVGPFDAPEGWTYLLEPFFNAKGRVCFNDKVQWAFLTPLLLLQVITLIWFMLIIRVAVKVIRGQGAEDNRSDDEDETGEDEYEEVHPLEKEVGVEGLDLKSWERRTGITRQASSSGVNLPGHSDRKELLGRIGCEKQVE